MRQVIKNFNPTFIQLAGHYNVVANVLSCLELESNTSLDSRADAAEIFAITCEDITPAAYTLKFKHIVALQQQDKELFDSAVSS